MYVIMWRYTHCAVLLAAAFVLVHSYKIHRMSADGVHVLRSDRGHAVQMTVLKSADAFYSAVSFNHKTMRLLNYGTILGK